jgi:hypothetical protein
MVRKALRGQRDPIVTATFALGRTWPLLLTLVFGSALIGNGVSGGWFTWDDVTVVRWVFGITAVSCFASVVCWNKRLLVVVMGVVMLCCIGRAWAIAGAYIDSRNVVDGGVTTYLVGSFIWLAIAMAEFIFTVALLTLLAVHKVTKRDIP